MRYNNTDRLAWLKSTTIQLEKRQQFKLYINYINSSQRV